MLQMQINHVKDAVHRLGGPTRASNVAGVSNATVHSWISRGRIPNFDKATVIANAAKVELLSLLTGVLK
jgi:hypothetical protein